MADTINYFKLALQSYCYMVASSENTELAQSLFNENDEEVLKNFIIETSKVRSKAQTIFESGRIFQSLLDKTNKDFKDTMAECVDGLNKFREFVKDAILDNHSNEIVDMESNEDIEENKEEVKNEDCGDKM